MNGLNGFCGLRFKHQWVLGRWMDGCADLQVSILHEERMEWNAELDLCVNACPSVERKDGTRGIPTAKRDYSMHTLDRQYHCIVQDISIVCMGVVTEHVRCSPLPIVDDDLVFYQPIVLIIGT